MATQLATSSKTRTMFAVNLLLDGQPASVELGFRPFLTIPAPIGFQLAILLLWLYPLRGNRFQDIQARRALEKQRRGEPAV
jgi:hypothetical protein